LGTVADFAVLGASTVTNTGTSVITGIPAHPGHVGVSPGSAITGFPPGILTGPGAAFHAADAVAAQAQVDLTTAYTNLVGRPSSVNLTGQNLGGLTLVPGVYNFDSSAQLTGTLTLNGLGNPNAVFIINIGSTLTTASASRVLLINGAQGGNVFWRVGSSATLGTTTSFAGDILAQASITLNTGATITCGAAWARTGAVTLDTNTISICALLTGTGVLPDGTTVLPDGTAVLPDGTIIQTVLGPTGFPLFAFLLPSSANRSQRAVAIGLDTAIGSGVTLPLAFANLFNLSPSQLANAFSQLQGELGTGAAQAGTQAMNSFLSLVTNPFADNRGFAPESPLPARPPLITKSPVYKAAGWAAPDPRRWGIWAAAYGSQNKTTGDPLVVGSHDRSVRTFGYATGLDYRVTPDTVVGFALAGGATNFGLSGGFGGGHSDMFQAAAYSATRVNAFYVSAALAYAWHRVSTERVLTVAGTDHLTADFSANNVGGRIEGGYRFAIPGALGLPGQYGFTPYAAGQVQAFRTPSYSESAASGSPIFALAYTARTTTTIRAELGARSDWTIPVDNDTAVVLRTRAAWAHDHGSAPSITATFLSLPGSSFTETGAAAAKDLLLASAGAEVWFRNGFSFAAWFDGEFAKQSQKYAGTGRLRYIW
jgi:outer membrane autotransporter protein